MRTSLLLLFTIITLFSFSVICQQNPQSRQIVDAVAYLQNDRLDEAEKILREIIRSTPSSADAHNLLGIVLDRTDRAADAEREYRLASKINPKAVSPLANLGVLLAKAKRNREAIQAFEEALKLNPNHPQSIINIGFVYSSIGDLPRAIEFLQKADLIQPNSFDILVKLGTVLYQAKRPDDARNVLLTANSISPDSAEPFYYLGLIAFEQNLDDAALGYFDNALASKPDLADAAFMRGEILMRHSRFADAVRSYEKAVSLDKTKSVYYVRLGGAYLFGHEFEKALYYFRQASELFPKIPEIRYFLAIAARTLGDTDVAVREAKASLTLKETADANALLGAILGDRSENVDAESYLRKAVALDANHFNANFDLGRLLVRQRQFAEALPFLQRAGTLKPADRDVHYQLFLAYSRLKRRAEADRELAIFKQLSDLK